MNNGNTFSNGLTPAEEERLALLVEECGEVIQCVGKIVRHGYDSGHPSGGPDNRSRLETELGDLLMATELMMGAEDIDGDSLETARIKKWYKARKYLHHQHDQYNPDGTPFEHWVCNKHEKHNNSNIP